MMTTTDRAMPRGRRALRVLQLASHSGAHRGGAVQMIRLAQELKQRGHEVVCAFHQAHGQAHGQEHGQAHGQEHGRRGRGEEADVLQEASVGLLTSAATENVGLLTSAATENVAGFDLGRWKEALRFRRWCAEKQFEIVHAHRDEALVFACWALLGRKRPAIVAGRGTVYRLRPLTWPWFWFRSRKVRRVVAVAEAVKESLTRYGVAAEKIHVVYGSVDEEVFRPGVDGSALRAEWGGSDAAPLIGNVAALVAKKGHAVFFEAAARIHRERPEARFVCVGAGKPEKFAEQLAELGLAANVVFAGHRDDVPQVMAALDVVVSSSIKGEGLTGTVREAMACGRPVVATDVGGNRELVRNGGNGLLVPPGDPESLARAILEILRNSDRAREMGLAARETILERFTNRRRGDAIEELYYDLCKGT